LLVPSVAVPAELNDKVGLKVPYEPEPDAAVNQPNVVVTAAVELIAAVPGTAAFAVENDVLGAEVTRATTTIVSVPRTVVEGSENVTV